MTAYFVEADGYLTGNIAFTMPILGNETRVKAAREVFEDAELQSVDGNRKVINNLFEILELRFPRSSWGFVGIADRGRTDSSDVVYERSQGVNEIGRDRGGYTDRESGGESTQPLGGTLTLLNGVVTTDPRRLLQSKQNAF